MTARFELVALLDAVLPEDVEVIPYARNIAAPEHSTVMVRLDKVLPSKAAAGVRAYEMALVLVGKLTTAGPADDELDNLLEDVLFGLESNEIPNGVTWSEATRATYGEPDATNPAYEVTCTVAVQIEEQES